MSELEKLNDANQSKKRSSDADQRGLKKRPRLGLIPRGNRYVFKEASPSASQEEDVLQYTEICQVGERSSVKFGYYEKTYIIGLKDEITANPPADWDWMTLAIDEMQRYAKRRMQFQEGDKLNLCVENRHFRNPISTGYKWKDDTIPKLVQTIQKIITSDTKVELKDCIFSVMVVKIPRGKGRSQVINLEEDLRTKRCILTIKNKDSLCGPRAIILGMSLVTDTMMGRKLNDKERAQVRKGEGRVLTQLAKQLCELIGWSPIGTDGFTLENIKECEAALDIQVKVICAQSMNAVIYKGAAEKDTKVFLYKCGNHFNVISRMKAFFGSGYYCEKCDIKFNNKDDHDCAKTRKNKKKTDDACPLCMGLKHASDTADPVYCNNCNRYCYNAACMAAHSVKVCPAAIRCCRCCKVMNRPWFRTHQCGWEMCRNCWERVEIAFHKCHMQPRKAKGGQCPRCPNCDQPEPGEEKTRNRCTYTEKYIFFDYEAQQETGVHIPNLIVAHYFDGTKKRFENNKQFCQWLISRAHKGYTAIAHYARGYDSQFILQYMIANTIRPNIVSTGTKLMLLEVPHLRLRIIDSHNFMQTPLSALPKMFGLTELKKGYFPHLFNTQANAGYVGPMPPKECYSPDTMKKEMRAAFVAWYEQRVAENYVFDLDKELYEYCDSDVDILRRACLELRDQFLQVANIDPFQYLTTPSVCMGMYRSKYMPENTIGIFQPNHDRYSKQAMAWLYSLENDKIKHALNGGEQVICGAPVDGYDPETRTVYQYHGCFWHGCPRCFDPDRINNHNKETMCDLYLKTVHRTSDLRNAGYTVVEKWSCDWKRTPGRSKWQRKSNKLTTPIVPRDAFYGGRTEVFQLKAKGWVPGQAVNDDDDEWEIDYIDQCSMYPGAMFFHPYPIGHPTKIFAPPTYNTDWFGIVKCKILPPRRLYIPVLPVRIKTQNAEKLVFPLCNACAMDECRDCTHTDDQRMLEGTWSTIEVNEAINRGYRIYEISEVWHFKKSMDLWRGYVRDFMKMKLESSPHTYPSNEAYAAEIRLKLDIDLDVDQIAPNPGKRALSKLCLNSLWGKFGQRNDQTQDEFVSDAWRFYEIMLDDTLEDIHILFVSEDMLHVTYKKKDHFVENFSNTNIMIAIYTTAIARLKLYEALAVVDQNALYCDTDSIVLKRRRGEPCPIPLGELLGEWTNELSGDDYIVKWLATGPKSYSFETRDGKCVTKVKGFTLHHKNAQAINAETMEKLIDGEIERVAIQDFQIVCDKTTKQLISKHDATKTLKFQFDKRVIVDNYNTLPYGYCS